MNILGKRYWYFAISLLIIVPGMILIALNGLPLSIDFTGGSILEVRFSGEQPAPADVVAVYESLGVKDAQVQTTGAGTIQVRSSFLDEASSREIQSALKEKFGELTVEKFDSVGPSIGEQVAKRAALAVGIAALAVVIYITFTFRGLEHAFRYGITAIVAMAHDVAIVMSVTAIGGTFWGWQVDALFLTALLTVIGFSVQDKIVVFDRIRENSSIYRRLPFETLANHSIIQTLQRSINTQLMTVEFMLLALALFGGITLREFAVILLVGLLSGTYSSIFIAAPLLVVWQNREWTTWFRRGEKAQTL
ncbi:MAG: protein-export membrane protein SecF [Anaerolineaceae bacterium]|jgi:preprotein translocase subunit SecF|nr:protein translocase subunit SecF [Anaerolineae bacterium]MBL1171031.1 protein translocase subunit SecF [Chloroflexota bacterium]MBV6465253.1 Protein translocase subunit SecF [Anaerolineales bacterium]MCE7906320.1 protein translocase subunit SecF [Anaerolineae bacterium CFX3]MDL1925774.1 protein translocase subunit SecF [Anaerolineae bacterium AMX1]OQY84152.1 MAG: protein translocase subunit SecF [Anaerolineae bacterium UTCFX3]GER79972.1 translocase subunit SecF [Candidatus Denitrolinea sym